jgi:hypothetical protein
MASLSRPHGRHLAHRVDAGQFVPPAGRAGGGRAGANPFAALPAFCRVAATLTPTADSEIKIEVWLPASAEDSGGRAPAWNGKLQAVGNGAWAGTLSYPAMASALAAGYAAASTDTGHTGGNANFIVGHPEKLVDFEERAVHEMTVAAKAVVDAFYGRAPSVSYFNGCSPADSGTTECSGTLTTTRDCSLVRRNPRARLRQIQLWQATHKDGELVDARVVSSAARRLR